MLFQLISKSHKDPIKTKKAMLRTRSNIAFFRHSRTSYSKVNSPIWPEFEHFLHYKYMGNFFVAQGRITPRWIVRSGPKSNSSKNLWLSSSSASLTNVRLKLKSLSFGQHFPHYKFMRAFGCHGNQSFNPICPKTLYCFPQSQMIQHVQFDQDWPTYGGWFVPFRLFVPK